MVNGGGQYTLPMWRCSGCPSEQVYSETRPVGWAWSRDGDGARVLLCGACRLRVVAERSKAGKAKRRRQGEGKVTYTAARRNCERCGDAFEVGSYRTKRFCSPACRTAPQNERAKHRGAGA